MNKTSTRNKPNEDFLTILDLWHLCLSHPRWFILSLTISVGLAFYYLARTPNLYTREATVLVKQETQGKSTGGNAGADVFNDIALIQQTANVSNVQRQLNSLTVLTDVVRRLHLSTSERDIVRIAGQIRSKLKVAREDDQSTIINLKYIDRSSKRAEEILNTIVDVYNEKWIEDKNTISASTSRFIQERLSVLEKDLSQVDDSISSFKIRHNITDLARVSEIYLQQQSQSETEILRLTNQLSMARYVQSILLDKASRHMLLPVNSGINSAVAETQISLYNNALLQLKGSMMATTAQNPLIIRQENELDEIRQNILSTIQGHIKALEIQMQAMQAYSGEAQSKIASSPNQAKHLVAVEREQKVKESLYLYLLQKKEENEISMTYNSHIIQLIDMPHGSDTPTSPIPRNILLGAVLMGLILPVAILFVRANLDDTVRSKQDIERQCTVSIIGEIPYHKTPAGKNRWFTQLLHRKTAIAPTFWVVKPDMQDPTNEAFRLIRTNLEFMTSEAREQNIYIVTSSYEGSGKTFVSINLALALAIKGRRVLLIDGDLRHATASCLFNCPHKGLSDYLGDKEADVSHLIVNIPDQTSIDILPVGTIPPNPTELLSDERLEHLLDTLRSQYDFILIDCPPAEHLADAGIIERHADRTLFVIRSGLFERKHLANLEDDVQNGKYKHISIILNATRIDSRSGYRYGYYYYSQYY